MIIVIIVAGLSRVDDMFEVVHRVRYLCWLCSRFLGPYGPLALGC